MNKFFYGLISIALFASCVGKHSSKAQPVEIDTAAKVIQHLSNLDTLHIDLVKSKLYWKGTKLRGAKKHEGEIQLASAFFLQKEGQIQGGEFRVDMSSISVTDIPADDSIPIKNINQHLKSEDFFDAAKYPSASFHITHMEKISPDSLEVAGNLTIKGITHNIRFKSIAKDSLFSTQFTFDRFQWDIGYEGITEKTVVDRDIELRIILHKDLMR